VTAGTPERGCAGERDRPVRVAGRRAAAGRARGDARARGERERAQRGDVRRLPAGERV